MLRIEKQGLRYHPLKTHPEEKLKQENKETTQVSSKAQLGALAFQVSLRKEQVHTHLLGKTMI